MKDKKPLNVEIANRIRIARENNHLTQEKMAEVLDLSVQFVSDMERGVVGLSDIMFELTTLDERQLDMARRAFIIFSELAHYRANAKTKPESPGPKQ